MFNLGLKLWSTNTGAYMDEARRLYDQGVFDYIELYVKPGSLDYLPRWADIRIPYVIHNAHTMDGFNLAKREMMAGNRRIYEESRRFADALDAPYVIFHGGTDGDIRETADQLASYAEPRALIENKPYRALPNPLGATFCRGADLFELLTVIDGAQCGFCLDFGHAVCAAASRKCEPYACIGEMMSLGPKMFHLTDNDDMSDEFDSHFHLGEGALDLKRIRSFLPDDAMVTLETDKDCRSSLDDFAADCHYMRSLQ